MIRSIVFLFLFVAIAASAENWILDSDIALSNAQTPNVVGYPAEAPCLAANPGHVCYEFTGQNLRYRKIVGGVWVDDATLKAAYDAEQTELASYFSVSLAIVRASGGSTDSCTTSPCYLDRNYPIPQKIESVTRNSVGNYTVNFVSGSWTMAPGCTASSSKGGGEYCVLNGLSTTSVVNIICYSGALVLTDTVPILICGGK